MGIGGHAQLQIRMSDMHLLDSHHKLPYVCDVMLLCVALSKSDGYLEELQVILVMSCCCTLM